MTRLGTSPYTPRYDSIHNRGMMPGAEAEEVDGGAEEEEGGADVHWYTMSIQSG